MLPVLAPAEMAAVDAAAPEPLEVLVGRAAAAVAREARDLLGGDYGRRVVVVAGGGNNGADGRVAAGLLARRGVRTRVLEAAEVAHGVEVPDCDLVIDAAFGTGFRGQWTPPPVAAPVLAVDIPSGIDGTTGRACGHPWRALRTVTFAALKPGLLLADGPAFAGEVVLAEIGLDTSGASVHLVQDPDVVAWVPPRSPDAHKWRSAVWVVAGSPGMRGAGWLCARGAMRGGAGYVRVSSPGVDTPEAPLEAVGAPLVAQGWGAEVAAGAERFGALAVGPGIGRDPSVRGEICGLLAAGVPTVLDADALVAVGTEPVDAAGPLVLTPHDGEMRALTGEEPGEDRIASARATARRHGAVVLLKGPTTVVAEPGGRVLLAHSGDERLATAGSGDVLTGLVAAHLACGADALEAAAAAAHLHGLAGRLAGPAGVVAGDVAECLGEARALLSGPPIPIDPRPN